MARFRRKHLAVYNWSSASPGTALRVTQGDGFTGQTCHRPFASPSMSPITPRFENQTTELFLHSLLGGEPQATNVGLVRLWSVPGASALRAFVPQRVQGNRWSLPRNASATATIGGSSSFRYVRSISADLSGSTLGPTWEIRLDDDSTPSSLVYTAGARDQLRLTLNGAVFTADLAHVPALDDLRVGSVGPQHFDLNVGPVMAVSASDPAVTRTVTITLSWDPPPIVDPE